MAPEVILANADRPYGKPCDMWSIGVVIYTILAGFAPFSKNSNILSGKYYPFLPKYWGAISEECKDLIMHLLVVDPMERYTVDQALAHKWIFQDAECLAARNLENSQRELKKHNIRRKFRSCVDAIIAADRFESILKKLRLSRATPADERDQIPRNKTTNSEMEIQEDELMLPIVTKTAPKRMSLLQPTLSTNDDRGNDGGGTASYQSNRKPDLSHCFKDLYSLEYVVSIFANFSIFVNFGRFSHFFPFFVRYELGRGQFGVVYLTTAQQTGLQYAAKIIDRCLCFSKFMYI